MLYLNEKDLLQIGINWNELVHVIDDAVKCLGRNDFVQPIKPYLRYKDLKNRIIAMPAYVGGGFNMAGIKWIASFPGNIQKKIPRAHSVVILNDAITGEPVAIINTALLSILRTASVTGLIIKYFMEARPASAVNLGIIGWGPIGQYHLKMCSGLFGKQIQKVSLYDLKPIDKGVIDSFDPGKIIITNSWEEAYRDADLFITCTVSSSPYIDQKPKAGSLQLNVSLRDYRASVYDFVQNSIIVDDWEEVCRENTDIEVMHKERNLCKEDTRSIVDVVCHDAMSQYDADNAIMFNPMGMAVFDIAVGAYFFNRALEMRVGKNLE